jgi:hypothetical protein
VKNKVPPREIEGTLLRNGTSRGAFFEKEPEGWKFMPSQKKFKISYVFHPPPNQKYNKNLVSYTIKQNKDNNEPV